MNRTFRALSTVAAVGVLAAAVVVPASANGLSTRCTGTAGAVTVPGELVVPAGASCVLTGTTIDGRVRLAADANLIISGGQINGDVIVNAGAYFDATDTTVQGRVHNRAGYGVFVDASDVGSYLAPAREGAETSFLTAYDTDFGGIVRADTGLVLLESATVTGNVQATDVGYVDVLDTWITGNLTVAGASEGSLVCGSEIDRNATYSGAAGVQIGTGDLLATCTHSAYIGGSLTIDDSTVGVEIADTIIRGNLTGTGNSPAPLVADDVRVRGTLGGQFGTAGALSEDLLLSVLTAEVDEREEVLDVADLAQERRSEALDSAEEAGPANL